MTEKLITILDHVKDGLLMLYEPCQSRDGFILTIMWDEQSFILIIMWDEQN